MADTLTLQALEIEDLAETPAETYRSDNSVYACLILSALSIAC